MLSQVSGHPVESHPWFEGAGSCSVGRFKVLKGRSKVQGSSLGAGAMCEGQVQGQGKV